MKDNPRVLGLSHWRTGVSVTARGLRAGHLGVGERVFRVAEVLGAHQIPSPPLPPNAILTMLSQGRLKPPNHEPLGSTWSPCWGGRGAKCSSPSQCHSTCWSWSPAQRYPRSKLWS